MFRLSQTLAIAATALALPFAALAQNNLNLDTGTAVSSGGDIAFGSSAISPVGSATMYSLGTTEAGAFSIFTETELATFASLYSTTPISGSSLAVNEFFAVHTNGGNFAKALVTAVSANSITLEYVTYNTSGATVVLGNATLGGPAGPSITQVQNNYSYILPGAPNYGISPGELVLISGNAMAAPGSQAVLQNPANALPTTLNGSTVTITVGAVTVNPAFYYAIPGYLGVVIPSKNASGTALPTGTGTITVSYGGQTSAPMPITIVAHAFGFDYYGGSLATVTDNTTGKLITTTNSAKPGEQIVFWGAGDGADTNNTDVSPPTHFDSLSGITGFYFGSVLVPVEYQGRSGYQGVDQINVQVPNNAPLGCAISVAAVSGSGSSAVSSNIVALPVATNGGTCIDPLSIVSPTEGSTLSGKSTVNFGEVAMAQLTDSTGTTDEALAIFYSISGSTLTGYTSSSQPSYGSCFVTQTNSTTPTSPYTFTGLNAGTVTVQGPSGGPLTLTTYPQVPGVYIDEPLPTGYIPASGGTFTFTATGAAPSPPGVGPFSTPVVFASPLVWSNAASDAAVGRASGVTVNWTGGAPGTYVEITGDSISSSTAFSASFICNAPVSAGTFTVPPVVLLALPAGTGSLGVGNYTTPGSFSATGLDFGWAIAFASTSIDATYN